MKCCMALSCGAPVVGLHEGQPYCAIHLAWALEPEIFRQENRLANPAVVNEFAHDNCGRRQMRFR